MQKLSPIIKPEKAIMLQQTTPVILIDARAGKEAKQNFSASHLAGAQWIDAENDLATPPQNAADGGRHPLPALSEFAALLGRLGIAPDNHVIVYDDKNGANAAARFWWMLRAVGHAQVQVLDGGYGAAVQAGFPTSSEVKTVAALPAYPVTEWMLPLAGIEEVEQKTQDSTYGVIDVRDAYRYKGESEPIDLIAGHIPGAINIPFSVNLDEEGFFKSSVVLKDYYAKTLDGRSAENIIVHCGSGVTACHTALAMDHAGLGIPKLYVGSWSEWSRTGRPIATETGE